MCRLLLTAAVVVTLLVSLSRPVQVRGCYAVVVGRSASADGSVLVGHSEQNGGRRILNFRRVPRRRHPEGAVVRLRRGGTLPQVPETWAFLWTENPGLENSDAYVNEWGVAVVSDGCPSREDGYSALVQRGEIRQGGIGYMLRRLVAERARTAREGVETAGRLVEQFGYYDSGRTYVIADSTEAWLFATVRGRRWVAQRVPDDAVVILPNIYIIGQVNLEDSKNFLASPDLIEYAVRRGWFDPKGGQPFSFRAVYRADRQNAPDVRRWRGRNLVGAKQSSWPPNQPSQVGITPKEHMTVASVAAILRNTETPKPLSNPVTQEGAVFQLRGDMPSGIGCVYWRVTAQPSINALTPWYIGITATPQNYYRKCDVETQLRLEHHFNPSSETFQPDLRLAWWNFKTLQDVVQEDYDHRIAIVCPVWEAFEQQVFQNQQMVEKKSLELWKHDPEAARSFLTDYCAKLAAQACRHADELVAKLKGK